MRESSVIKKQWDIREYLDGDEEQILELRGATTGDSKDPQWWNWIYRNGPDGPSIFFLAVDNEKIIGINPNLPLRIKIEERVCKSALSFDVMTHPDYQRQGVLTELAKLMTPYKIKSGFNLDHGTSTIQRFPVYRKLESSHGYTYFVICQPRLLTKVIDWGNILKTRFRIPSIISKICGYVLDRITGRISHTQDSDTEIVQISSFDKSFDKFWLRASELKKIMIVRDMKYLNWRYCEKPGNEYNIFAAKRHKEIVGFIVVKLERNAMTRGFIVDLLTLPDEDTVATELITRAAEYLQEKGAASILCLMLQDTPYYRILRKKGFIDRKSGIQLNVRLFDQNLSKDLIADYTNWYFTWGDTDTS
jgi:GNAT superfamily N-acetyltransferase